MASFSLNLQRRVELSLIATGKFDGSHACLTAATSGGNIIVHSPHRSSEELFGNSQSVGRLSWSGEIAELHIGQQVTALCIGRLEEDEREFLLVGTHTHILAYQIEDNADLFYKEMRDGVHHITTERLGWIKQQVIIVGGNCSVTVMDHEGNELYWTIASGIVKVIIAFDFDGDAQNELLIGTEDSEIKAQKETLVMWQVKETSPVSALLTLPGRKFAYAVANGTVGVYENGTRIWRGKSKHKITSMKTFDINGDGVLELITGWTNGKVDARICSTGEIIFRIQLNSAIAGIVEADYRRTGRADLVIVSENGEVRGYLSGTTMDISEPGELYRHLLTKKEALEVEIRQRQVSTPSLFMGTKLAVNLTSTRGAVRLALASGPGLVIFCAIVFAEEIFEGETFVAHPRKPTGELEIELRPPKDGPIDIHMKTFVGSPGSDLLQVYELMQQLPSFCMYEIINPADAKIEDLKDTGVKFETGDRPQRIALWLNRSLAISEELEIDVDGPNAGRLDLCLRGLRDNKLHFLSVNASGRVNMLTTDPTFAGDVVQSLANYLGIVELSSEANFPAEEKRMVEILEKVKELKEIEVKLQTEAAGVTNVLKALMIRLEDSRILDDAKGMRKRITQLQNVGENFMRENEIRDNNYKELTSALKELNSGVQNASRIRVGSAATNAINRCRAAIKDENPKALIQAIRNG
ncbi:Bardet-Biedl syndrome 2 protein homolog isoform X1 [Leptopilina boulardi]|uniref:Bardet-Biedl syndrome 2 protein homolog isoform X1 n=1 Tax=Leptopilina boulardi TaxID=63433 RepID=UPI0021F545F6|nr:Bardet-Biedl syndrome 2 protein homolog isoform X1 [Leptopilina boulardi]